LRGGLYKQGFGKLRDEKNRCCCLGVLCDQVAPGEWHETHGTWEHGGLWTKPKPSIMRDDIAVEFMIMNDQRKYSFKKIANWIEKHM
jgi:hypothetical protein